MWRIKKTREERNWEDNFTKVIIFIALCSIYVHFVKHFEFLSRSQWKTYLRTNRGRIQLFKWKVIRLKSNAKQSSLYRNFQLLSFFVCVSNRIAHRISDTLSGRHSQQWQWSAVSTQNHASLFEWNIFEIQCKSLTTTIYIKRDSVVLSRLFIVFSPLRSYFVNSMEILLNVCYLLMFVVDVYGIFSFLVFVYTAQIKFRYCDKWMHLLMASVARLNGIYSHFHLSCIVFFHQKY